MNELSFFQIYKPSSDKERHKGLYEVLLKPTAWIEMSAQELLKPLMTGHLITVLMMLMDWWTFHISFFPTSFPQATLLFPDGNKVLG